MAQLLEKLKSRIPSLLRNFDATRISLHKYEKWNGGDSFVSREIYCNCGSNDFFLKCRRIKKITGLIFKKEITENKSPIYAICNECKSTNLVFDELRHGWNAANTNNQALSVTDSLESIFDKPVSLVVNYSYQSIENYEDLIESGCKNPEDYFDTFTIYAIEGGSKSICIASFECA